MPPKLRFSKGPRPAEVIEVIRTELLRRGRGTEDSPVRVITQFWSKDGDLLAEVDPWIQKERLERAEEIDRIKRMADLAASRQKSNGTNQELQDFSKKLETIVQSIREDKWQLVNIDEPRIGDG